MVLQDADRCCARMPSISPWNQEDLSDMSSLWVASGCLIVGRKDALEYQAAIVGKLEPLLRWQHDALHP